MTHTTANQWAIIVANHTPEAIADYLYAQESAYTGPDHEEWCRAESTAMITALLETSVSERHTWSQKVVALGMQIARFSRRIQAQRKLLRTTQHSPNGCSSLTSPTTSTLFARWIASPWRKLRSWRRQNCFCWRTKARAMRS